MLTDANIDIPSRSMLERMQLGTDDLVPVLFPFAHVGGMCMVFSLLRAGTPSVLIERYRGAETIEFLAEANITILAGGTTLVRNFLEYQRRDPGRRLFPRLRFGLAGAAPKPPQLHAEVRAELCGLGVLSAYGLTEAPTTTFTPLDSSDEALATTEGPATEGTELRVVGADGNVCSAGDEREIRIRGRNVMRGYLDP